jgi:predicted XRE-type DNA-binding protein
MSKTKPTSYQAMLTAARLNLKKDTAKRSIIGKAVRDLIAAKELTRAAAGLTVKEAASQMSRLMCGNYGEFSVDRLFQMFVMLGGSVDVVLTPPANLKRRGRGKATVRVRSRRARRRVR